MVADFLQKNSHCFDVHLYNFKANSLNSHSHVWLLFGWMLGWSVCTQVSTTAAWSLDVDNNQSFSAVLFPTNGCSDTLCYYGITSHMEITLMDNKHFLSSFTEERWLFAGDVFEGLWGGVSPCWCDWNNQCGRVGSEQCVLMYDGIIQICQVVEWCKLSCHT